MKASPLPRILAALALAAGLAGTSAAQDSVMLKSGQERKGKVVGTSGTNLRLQIDGAVTGIPLADVREIKMAAPPEFEAAAAQLAKGDAKGAIAALQKINEAYGNLPAAWAQRAAALLGDAKLEAGDLEGAKEAYAKFSAAYPDAKSLADLGMARLAVEAGNFDEAAKLLAPVLALSGKSAFPPPEDGPALCQGHYLMGRVKEAAGEHQAALDEYLMASAVYPFDTNAAAAAQKRADSLRTEHAGLIAP